VKRARGPEGEPWALRSAANRCVVMTSWRTRMLAGLRNETALRQPGPLDGGSIKVTPTKASRREPRSIGSKRSPCEGERSGVAA